MDGVINETITLKNFRNIEVVLILEQIIDDKTFYHQVGEAMTDAIAKAGIKL